MYLSKKLSAILLVLVISLMPFAGGCSPEETQGERMTDLLVYVGPEGLYACSDTEEGSVLLAKGEFIHSPHISPDGRFVYFNNSNDIFVVPSEGGTPTLAAADGVFSGFLDGRLLSCSKTGGVRAYDPETGVSESMFPRKDEGFVSSVLVSPDGKKLAASVRYIDVGIERPEGVYIRYADTSDMDRFTSEDICTDRTLLAEPLCWLADGGAIVFSCGAPGDPRTGLWLFPIAEGAASPVGGSNAEYRADARVAISGDGRTAAFLTYRDPEDTVETVCLLDLTRARCSYIPSGNTGVSGVSLSGDGALVAYTSLGIASGLYVYSNDTTLCVVGGDGKNQYAAPDFAHDGSEIFFVGWGERLLAETDSNGEAVGTYTDTVASVYRASSNSAGSIRLADGLKFPDGVYTDDWADMYDHYEYVPAPVTGE